jgi:biopolymer transport protein ExbD
MQFNTRQRRQAPNVIIVSLIDVLLVVLIFMMVTTAFKQQPAVKLALPESRQPKSGATSGALIVTIPKQGPICLGIDPLTFESLRSKLKAAVQANPETSLAIRADTDAPWGEIVKVMDAAKEANIKAVNAFLKSGVEP